MRTGHGNEPPGSARDLRGRSAPHGRARLMVVAALPLALGIGAAAPRLSPAAAPGAVVVVRADTITPALVALGEKVFQGKSGGALCTTCHGRDAKGVKGLGPDLTDDVWLHGDGSLAFLETIIRTGVMQPREGGGVMPPFGGAPLEPDQLEAVAAYVYSLSHR